MEKRASKENFMKLISFEKGSRKNAAEKRSAAGASLFLQERQKQAAKRLDLQLLEGDTIK